MKVSLLDWDRYSRVWDFDPRTGEMSATTADLGHGYVWLPNLQGPETLATTATYAQNGALWFQYATKRWDLSAVTITHAKTTDGRTCTFTITSDGGIELEISYLSVALDPINRSDPSFDALDEELQDLYLFVARMQPNREWREDVAIQWAAGIRRAR